MLKTGLEFDVIVQGSSIIIFFGVYIKHPFDYCVLPYILYIFKFIPTNFTTKNKGVIRFDVAYSQVKALALTSQTPRYFPKKMKVCFIDCF